MKNDSKSYVVTSKSSNEQSSNEQGSFHGRGVNANSSMYQQFPSVIRVETARSTQIGKINGNPIKWPVFRDSFIVGEHNKDFDPVTKVSSYNDKYHLILGILGKLFAVQRQEKESHESITTVLDAYPKSVAGNLSAARRVV